MDSFGAGLSATGFGKLYSIVALSHQYVDIRPDIDHDARLGWGSVLARLIVVSNRVSVPGDETKRAGGLEVALPEQYAYRPGRNAQQAVVDLNVSEDLPCSMFHLIYNKLSRQCTSCRPFLTYSPRKESP